VICQIAKKSPFKGFFSTRKSFWQGCKNAFAKLPKGFREAKGGRSQSPPLLHPIFSFGDNLFLIGQIAKLPKLEGLVMNLRGRRLEKAFFVLARPFLLFPNETKVFYKYFKEVDV